MDDLITQAEVSRLLGTSPQQVKRWVDRGILPHVVPSDDGGRAPSNRTGTARLVRRVEVLAFADRFPVGPDGRRWVRSPGPSPRPGPSDGEPSGSEALRRARGFLSSYEAADLLGISQSTLKGWIASGAFPVRRPGRFGIHLDDVRDFTVSRSPRGKARTPSEVVSLGVVSEACGVSDRTARGWVEDGTLKEAVRRGNRRYVSAADLIALIESRGYGPSAASLVRERAMTGGCKPSATR